MAMIEIGGKNISIPRCLGSPLLLALAITLLLFLLGHPSYETNDDMTIISLLSGKMGLEPQPDGIFMSLPLSWLLYALYGIADSVPWYSVLLYFFLFIGFYLGLKTIFLSHLQSINKMLLSAGYTLFYMHLFYELNFAAVSLLIWLMAVGYMTYLGLNEVPPRPVEAGMGLILGISHLIRPDIVWLSITFSMPIVAAFVAPVPRKRLIYLLTPLLLFAIVSTGMEYLLHSNSEYADYQQFNRVRSDFTDTEMSSLAAQTPAALNKAGWSYDDYALAKFQWFHDGTIYSIDRMTAFLTANKKAGLSLVSTRLLAESVTKYKAYLSVVVLCCTALLFNEPGKYPIPPLRQSLIRNLSRLLLIVVVAGIAILAGIRFPTRVAIPLFSFLIVLAVVFRPFLYRGHISSAVGKRLFYGAAFSLLIYLIASNYLEIEESHARNESLKKYTVQSFKEGLYLNGPDTILVHATSDDSFLPQFANPFHEFSAEMKITFFPMGWLIDSPAYHTFLKKNGFGDRKRTVPAMVNNRNVLFCFFQFYDDKFDIYTANFLGHLQQHYAPLFPGQAFTLEKVLDRRVYNRGWIFFRIVAKQAYIAE